MWASRTHPLAALNNALKPNGLTERIRAVFQSPVKSLDVEAEITGIGKLGVSAGFENQQIQTNELLHLPELLDALIGRHGKVLLLLDEVQYLAKPQFEDIVAALRTALDTRREHIKVVYTGSSRVRLQRMFDTIKAPLFRSSQTTDFPDLDQEFVYFMIANVQEVTGNKIDQNQSMIGFNIVSKSPGLFREAIETVVMSGIDDIAVLCKSIAERAEEGAGYEDVWASLKDIDKAVIKRVIEKKPLYNSEACKLLAAEIGVSKQLTAQQIQSSVKRLVENQALLPKGSGRYEVEDPGFSSWITKRM